MTAAAERPGRSGRPASNAAAAVDFSLYLVTGRRGIPGGRGLLDAVREALEGGVGAVQLREKDLPPRDLLPLALELRDLTRRHGARLLVNDRVDVALAAGADGVHLAATSLPVAAVRRITGPGFLVGVSTHSVAEVLEAEAAGADFVTFGPVYPTPSKARYGPPVGLGPLREACRRAALPVFALGGVKAANVAEVLEAGAAGVALISAVLWAPRPAEAARAFARLLGDRPAPTGSS
ncbi:thiamine phosphate synthase [Dissulfurirhabdus thermomarina]|uniref:Thiamine-phosphate synthase n=1 Tax=Dissulfurirhabdus thermomarina TaxID=1765737 RepID=A0A6N9TQD0_DISTH|nr:thiamine phosphate synthase [Dissulfurirhabdus thermomarina]NDY42660.1 thiamine phosphate synthase [Dissulfurirhabdus thermomarina]NMX23445.1 thiamine phosphate synthase [Dissulfurirhabdus thermomarina]